MRLYLPQSLNKIGLAPQNRALAWVLLLLLTAVLLVYPVHLSNEYHPIQAPYLFDNLLLFGIVFCIWMLLIILLIFSRREERGGFDWEKLALACVFSLVFLGFWVVITPYGSYADGTFNMGHVRWLLEEGNIPVGHDNLVYFDFPGMHLLVSALSQLCGLGIFESRMLFLLFNIVVFSALMYILFGKLLRNNRLASIAVLLVMMASVALIEKMHIFTPGALGFTLLAGFLVTLSRSETELFGSTVSDRLLMLILFIAMTISYFATSFLAPLLLLGVYAVQRLGRDEQALVRPRTIILLLSIVVAWEIYWTWHTFDVIAAFMPKIWEDIITGEFVTTSLTLLSANVGGTLPLWATIVRFFWWALLGFGTLLGLRNLFRLNKLSLAERLVTGGLLGVILLTVVGIFGTAGGYQFSRFLLYAPLFCIPILLMFLYQSGTRGRRGLVISIILVFVLAFPTFLSTVNTIATDAVYPDELSAGEFMESHSIDKGENHVLYSLTFASRAWAYYYIPDTTFRNITESVYYSRNKGEVWQEVQELTSRFQYQWVLPEIQKIFVTSEKDTVLYQHLLAIPPDDPRWEEIRGLLSSTNRIFNNGHIQMYISQ